MRGRAEPTHALIKRGSLPAGMNRVGKTIEEDALNLKSSVLVCLPKHGGRDLPALVSIAPYWDLVAME